MKKTIFMALVILTGAFSSTAMAAKKEKKQQPTAEQQAASRDSVSYMAGLQFNDGLIPFLQQQFHVDSAYMGDFLIGFKEARAKEDDKRFNAYIAGTQIAQLLDEKLYPQVEKQFAGTPDSIDKDRFYDGFLDGVNNKRDKLDVEFAKTYIQDKAKQRHEEELLAKFGDNKKAGEDFLAKNAKKKNIKTLPSGLQYEVITEGTGAMPKKSDMVKVKYEGSLIDGTVFDSSANRGDGYATFKVNQLIEGWTEALQMMPEGSHWKVYIPYKLAYGERQQGKDIKPFSALIFDMELKEIVKAKKTTKNNNEK